MSERLDKIADRVREALTDLRVLYDRRSSRLADFLSNSCIYMTPDGISDEEWEHVFEITIDIVNASAIDDEVLDAHHTMRLFEYLDELEADYGRIPSILATRADFTSDPLTAIELHEEALTIANDPISKCLSLQSLVRLMIEVKRNNLSIAKRLEELEKVTDTDDSINLEELHELQADFDQLKFES